MRISKYEQEIVINFNAAENMASLYTSNPKWMRKMDGLVKKNPQLFSVVREDEFSKTYEFPKTLVCIRSKEKTMSLSNAQKDEATKRLNN